MSDVHLVHDDREERERLRELIARHGFRVRAVASAAALVGPNAPSDGCLVVRLANGGAGELLRRVGAKSGRVPAILLAAPGGVPAAVTAMRAGAASFLEEPVADAALMREIRRALGSVAWDLGRPLPG